MENWGYFFYFYFFFANKYTEGDARRPHKYSICTRFWFIVQNVSGEWWVDVEFMVAQTLVWLRGACSPERRGDLLRVKWLVGAGLVHIGARWYLPVCPLPLENFSFGKLIYFFNTSYCVLLVSRFTFA